MKKVTKLLILINMIFSISSAHTLKETLDMARVNNDLVKAQKAQLQKSQEEYLAVLRKTYPLLNYDASYKYVSEVAKIEMPSIAGQPAKEIETSVKDNYDNGLTLSWLAFNGFAKDNQVILAENKKELAENMLVKTEKEIALQVAKNYLNVKLLQIQKAVLENAVNRVAVQYNKVRSLVDNGQALPIELMNLDLARNDYQEKIISLKGNLATQEQNLANQTGQNIEVDTEKINVLKKINQEISLENNSDYQALLIQDKMTSAMYKIASAKNYPDIIMIASARSGKPGLNPIENKWMNYTTAGIGLQWNLWDWGGRQADVAAQVKEKESLASKQDYLKKQLDLQYQNALREYQTLQEQGKVMAESVKLAKEKLKIIETQSKEGTASHSDYRDAEAELTERELKMEQQQINIYQKQLEIDYLSGRSIDQWSIQ